MKLFVSFAELKELAYNEAGIPLEFRYGNESQFKVSSFIKVPLIGEKEISLSLAIESASFACVALRNESGMLSNVILNMLEELVEKIVSKSSPSELVNIDNNSIKIYPNSIEKVKEIEKTLVMHGIEVVENGFLINLSFSENRMEKDA